ncbi:MAG: hypothetical protein KAS29_19575 [Bacteroidales bacterium]|nr:hypothetical protein [Bacteroidales bacterium]
MMKDSGPFDPEQFGKLNQRFAELESRISRLEERTANQDQEGIYRVPLKKEPSDAPVSNTAQSQNEAFESRIGEYGMAWMGNIVLLVGILFLTQYLQNNNRELISLVFGFSSIVFVYLLGYLTRKSLPYMSRLFSYNGHLLLYIQVMRICMFKESMVIHNPFLSHTMVLLVLFSLIYLAYKNNSQVLAILAWIMMGITAATSGSTHLMLSLMVVVSGTAILFAIRKEWWTGLIISIFFVYFIFLVWIMGNPFLSRDFEIRTDHQMGYVYLFTVAMAYSFLALLPKSERTRQNQLQPSIVLNGLGFSLIIALVVPAFFAENYYIYFGLIAAFCIVYSIWLQVRGNWNTIAAMYALYSFVALSITIAGIYQFPLAFFLLAIQSLLVVSMALWFRSRFMVIINTILFAGLLIAYVATSDPLNSINFSFALVALVTARILNWKKKRLEIRTELIRNIFLFTGAIMVLYSLHEAVPQNFITLSWTLSAVVFFILSVIIRNMKYRWLGIITMLITVFYLFLVDLSNISLGYRIVALMVIAAISLGISIFYSRRQKNRKEEQK